MTDDYKANRDTTGVVVVDGPATPGSIETANDSDWLKIDLIAGREYQFDIGGTGGNPLLDPFTRLRDNSGRVVARDNDSGPEQAAQIRFEAQSSEAYFLQVQEFGRDATGDYLVSVQDLGSEPPPDPDPGPEPEPDPDPEPKPEPEPPAAGDDYPANQGTSGVVVVDGPATSGTIEKSNDTDWLRVDLIAGRTYQIDVGGAADNPLVDPFVRLADSGGSVVARDNNSGPGQAAQITFQAQSSESYFISVHEGGRDATGTYAVRAVELGTDPTPPPPDPEPDPDPPPPSPDLDLSVMLIGDSFSIPDRGLPGKLENALEQHSGGNVDIIDLTRSGRTSYGARDAVLEHFDDPNAVVPEVAVLAIGINDALRNRNPEQLEKVLGRIINELDDNGVQEVVLAAPESFFPLKDTKPPGQDEPLGLSDPADQAAFREVYIDLADANDLILADDFIEGLIDDPSLLETDVFHPNPLGVDRILDNILPEVIQAVDAV